MERGLVLCILVLASMSRAYEVIELESIKQMAEDADGLLIKLACEDPTSDVCVHFQKTGTINSPSLARRWLEISDVASVEAKNRNSLASWNYETNITEGNSQAMHMVGKAVAPLMLTINRQTSLLSTDNLDPRSKRILSFTLGGERFSSDEHSKRSTEIEDEMSTIYATGEVCRQRPAADGRVVKRAEQCLHMEPGLQDIMAKSRDYDELLWAWKGWRDAVGPAIGKLYPEHVSLKNELSRSGGYDDYGDELRSDYEDPNFVQEIDALWDTVRPAYLQIHAYVRRKLADFYGEDKVNPRAPIPAHLLGNMWAQKWGQIFDLVTPYPEHGTVDVTDEMQAQGWTVSRMFHQADKFFLSLGWESMPDTFWTKSMMERPRDRQVECHGSARDLYKNRDVRIKMCTEITMEDLYTVHHEMGHCQYYLLYRDQPSAFRTGANMGFHEAVGDTIALSVVTPDYLHTIGLLKSSDIDKTSSPPPWITATVWFTPLYANGEFSIDTTWVWPYAGKIELEINYLMRHILDKIAFLPFGLLIDKWRWRVFSGEIQPEDYNTEWWNMRREYQGIASPIERGPDDFDPGAKYHIPSGTPYIRYFVSFIVQYQFQKSLCEASGSTVPLHLCNIFESKAAGDKFSTMLKMGKSRPWQDAMEVLTGQRRMDAGPLIEYFKPLLDWLQAENEKNNELIGWE